MKILFVCPTDPRETSYGGQQRTHVLWPDATPSLQDQRKTAIILSK